MEALEYLKTKEKMTNNCKILCVKCPLYSTNTNLDHTCSALERFHPDKAIEIVENWAKRNPVKTFLAELKERCPNIRDDDELIDNACPYMFFSVSIPNCKSLKCKDCWNQEYKEDNND